MKGNARLPVKLSSALFYVQPTVPSSHLKLSLLASTGFLPVPDKQPSAFLRAEENVALPTTQRQVWPPCHGTPVFLCCTVTRSNYPFAGLLISLLHYTDSFVKAGFHSPLYIKNLAQSLVGHWLIPSVCKTDGQPEHSVRGADSTSEWGGKASQITQAHTAH